MNTGIKRNKGFTFIEILVVIIIAITLAVVTLPLMKTSINRFISREAITTLRAILAAEKRYFSKNSTYTTDLGELGFGNGELNGVFFSEECYSDWVLVFGGYGWYGLRIRCIPAVSNSAKSPQAALVRSWGDSRGKYIGINIDGFIYSNIDWLDYEEYREWEEFDPIPDF